MSKAMSSAAVLGAALLAAGAAWAAPYTVVPGVYGFGTQTRAAYGGATDPVILHVNTLAKGISNSDSTHGSFQWAISRSYPRVVVFDVSGVIQCDDYVETGSNPYLTIAGQTAPGPIAFDGELRIWTHDVLIQHLAVRNTHNITDRDGIGLSDYQGPNYNIVVDHCSVSWATDENIAVWALSGDSSQLHDITFSNCLIAEGIYPHSCGFIVSGRNVAMTGSILAHDNNRHPFVKVGSESAFFNNLIYNYSYRVAQVSGDYDYNNDPCKLDFRGNVAKGGPDSGTAVNSELVDIMPDFDNNFLELFMADNIREGSLKSGFDVLNEAGISGYERTSSPISLPTNLAPYSSSLTYDTVLASAGARPTDRDVVDARIINEIQTGTGGGKITSAPTMPGYSSVTQAFVPVALPHVMYDAYYTNLEHQLHQLAAALEGVTPNQAPVVDAGENQSVALPEGVALAGTVTDDGLPAGASVTTEWITVSGPGVVTFDDASAVDTRASFESVGTYVLRLSASDTERSGQDEVTITVHAPQETVFSAVSIYGNRNSYAENDPTRWDVVEDAGDLRYFLNTSAFSSPGGDRLGECAVVPGHIFGDVVVSAKVRSAEDLAVNTGADYVLVLGYQDANNYYYAMFNRRDIASGLYLVSGGQRTELANVGHNTFTDSAYHEVEFRREGGELSMSLDGTVLASATDTTLHEGLVGVGSYNDSAYFDDVVAIVPGSCAPGTLDCNNDALDGCETDVTADAANCGACEYACGSGELCAEGSCVSACPSYLSACGPSCVDLNSNVLHCGTCDQACASAEVCESGVCRLVCPAGAVESDGKCVLTAHVEGCACAGSAGSAGWLGLLLVLVGAAGLGRKRKLR